MTNIKHGTHVLHATAEEAIVADVGLDTTTITDGEKSYQVPTFYLELLFMEAVE